MKVIRYPADLHDRVLPDSAFDPAEFVDGFETLEVAVRRRRKLIRILTEGDSVLRSLAQKLSNCRKEARCLSGACPVCMRRVRRIWAGKFVAPAVLADQADWMFVTAIPARSVFALGTLEKFNPRRLHETLRKQFSRGPLAQAKVLGGIDFNYHQDRKGQSFWCPHWHLLVKATHAKVHEALGKYYRPTELARRPLEVRPLDRGGLLDAATYLLKSVYKLDMPRSFSFQRPFTEIEEVHWAELAPLLDKWGFCDRVFQKGFWS